MKKIALALACLCAAAPAQAKIQKESWGDDHQKADHPNGYIKYSSWRHHWVLRDKRSAIARPVEYPTQTNCGW